MTKYSVLENFIFIFIRFIDFTPHHDYFRVIDVFNLIFCNSIDSLI